MPSWSPQSTYRVVASEYSARNILGSLYTLIMSNKIMCIGKSFWGLQKPHSVLNPFGDVGLRIGPIGGLSADSSISPQEETKKEIEKEKEILGPQDLQATPVVGQFSWVQLSRGDVKRPLQSTCVYL